MLKEMPRKHNSSSREKRALFLAGQPAVDFLNTEWPNLTGKKEDFFETDDDVFTWLRQAGLEPENITTVRPSGALLRAARALRDTIRTLVETRKAGKQNDLADLNAFLAGAASYLQLSWTKSRTVALATVRSSDTAEQVLAPLVVKAAELLAYADFRRVRRCDDPTCVHWFYDQTKPGKRRWCSMSTCGNRLKVKRYRRRRKSA
jgi:predicted RNA-binding Zn ribbon-like protein